MNKEGGKGKTVVKEAAKESVNTSIQIRRTRKREAREESPEIITFLSEAKAR